MNVGVLLMVSSTIPGIQFQIISCSMSGKSVILKPHVLPQVSQMMWYIDITPTRQARRNEKMYQELCFAISLP